MSLSSLSATLLLTGLLPACSVSGNGAVDLHPDPDEQDFPSEWASAWCDRAYECDQADFENTWSSHDACVADKSDDAQFAAEWSDLLCDDYDAAAAGECISAIDDGDCADWSDDDWKGECANVYGC